MITQIIDSQAFEVVPWRNGLGSTTQLWVEPGANSEEFLYRISIAPVQADGPFSDFSDYHRSLILIEGSGITLEHSTGQSDCLEQRFDTAHFSGAWQTDAQLHRGPITDFNVMARKGACESHVSIVHDAGPEELVVDSDWLLVFAPDQTVHATSPDSVVSSVPAGSLLKIRSPIHGDWTLHGGPAICVQIEIRTP
jgi:uncharacterized protein